MSTADAPGLGHNQPPPLRDILAENHAGLAGDVETIAERANKAPREIKSEDDLDAVGTLVKDAGTLARRVESIRTAEKAPHLQAGREVDAFFGAFTDRLERIQKVFQGIANEYVRRKREEERRRRGEEARKAREEEERQRKIAEAEAERNRPTAAEKHEAKAEAAAERAATAEAAAQATPAEMTRTRTSSGTLATARSEWAFEITDYSAIPLNELRPYLVRADVEKAIRSFVRVNKDAVPLAGVRIFEDVKASFR